MLRSQGISRWKFNRRVEYKDITFNYNLPISVLYNYMITEITLVFSVHLYTYIGIAMNILKMEDRNDFLCSVFKTLMVHQYYTLI